MDVRNLPYEDRTTAKVEIFKASDSLLVYQSSLFLQSYCSHTSKDHVQSGSAMRARYSKLASDGRQ